MLSRQKSIIPDLPRENKISDSEGTLTSAYMLFFDQFISSLQQNLTPEGNVIPQQSATNIANLTSDSSNYKIIYDNTNNDFSGNIINPAGQQWCAFATIQTYAGNPNTHLAGNVLQLCYDTTDKVLYICTTTGTATAAVWTAV